MDAMLILGRKHGEAILIDGPAEVTYLDKGRLAIDAPKTTRILRKEVAERETASQEGHDARRNE